jgi:hypothetical protein
MANLSRFFTQPHANRMRPTGLGLLCGTALASALLLGACAGDVAVTVENTQAAKEVERLTRPQGAVYPGWRVFQEKCASCHGPDASGTGKAPDLLPIVQQMGPRGFVDLVLRRYDWNLPRVQGVGEQDALDRLVDDILQRKDPAVVMPAWQDNPSVSAHILDLYAYLSARAEGSQGKGRPSP